MEKKRDKEKLKCDSIKLSDYKLSFVKHELDAGEFKTCHRQKNVFARFTTARSINTKEQKWPVRTENMPSFLANPVRAD